MKERRREEEEENVNAEEGRESLLSAAIEWPAGI